MLIQIRRFPERGAFRGIEEQMKRVFAAVFSALLGVSLAIMLHCTFMIVKNESSMMLPDIEPGSDVVIYLREKGENLKKGDIVAYTPT